MRIEIKSLLEEYRIIPSCFPEEVTIDDVDFVLCGFMDLHTDRLYDGLDEEKSGTFEILVHWARPGAVFLHRNGGELVASVLEAGNYYRFNGHKQHGLLPEDIAEQCVRHQSTKPHNQWKKKMISDENNKHPRYVGNSFISPVQLIWQFWDTRGYGKLMPEFY